MRRWARLAVLLALAATPVLAQTSAGLRGSQPTIPPPTTSPSPAGQAARAAARPAAAGQAGPRTGRRQAPSRRSDRAAAARPRAAAADFARRPGLGVLPLGRARDYYRCLADGSSDSCPQTWSSCNTACSASARRGG